MAHRVGLIVLLSLVGMACTSENPSPVGEPTGPAEIRNEVVRRHAREFETDLADRAPGSQGEQGAAAYILGHLQQAGYFVQLDGVPVGNLVRSTNLLARPPSGEDPVVVVTVAYGTGPNHGGGERALGVFLELARALRVAEPNHSVEFVALGAERSTQRRGGQGSRRFVQNLLDDELDPLLITVFITPRGRRFYVATSGVDASPLTDRAEEQGLRPTPVRAPLGPSVFSQAGLDHLRIVGPEPGTGEVLLEYLADLAR